MIELTSTRPAPLDRGSAAKFGQDLRQAQRDALNDVGKSVQNRVRQPIKRNPGDKSLHNSIQLDRAQLRNQVVNVHTESPKAVFRELDMPAHEIKPKTKKVLVFKPKRARNLVFAKKVNHPGSKGTHSWQHGSTAMRMRLPWAMKYATEAALRGERYQKRYS
jgi:hypothetical protein